MDKFAEQVTAFLLSFFGPRIVPDGALPDSRPEALKEQDFSTQEVLTGTAIPFNNMRPTTLGATRYTQEYTSSCVFHGFATQLEYEGIMIPGGMSQISAYRKRSNYPGAGSIAVDAYTKIKEGQRRNVEQPVTPRMTEAQANALAKIIGTKLLSDFKYFEYADKKGNLLLADVPPDVAAGKAVSIFIYATEAEWSAEYVEVKSPNLSIGNAYVRHCVTIMPYGDFTENGKKWLAVQDSAAFGGRHLRYMSLDFFMRRGYYASKVYKVGDIPAPTPLPGDTKPTEPVQFGDRNSAVMVLQDYLVKNGYLAVEFATGYYGANTARGVQIWQLERWEKFTGGVRTLLELAGKRFGPESVAAVE